MTKGNKEGPVDKSDKAKITGQIYERKDSDLLRLFIALVGSLIEENREKIDTARTEEIPKIQGRIIQLKELRDIFTKHPIIAKK